jgi:hypothetical protein
MPEAHYTIGQSFPVQFAWRLPNAEYVRAVFEAEVLDLVPSADKYIVRLNRLMAGREETADGQSKTENNLSFEYWRLVGKLIGRKITIAYEADDSRALYLRLETLTGEHNFFTRYEDAEVIARGLETRLRRSGNGEDAPP